MFDDIKEPEDIFAATDKVAPQVTPPTDQPVPVPSAVPPLVASADKPTAPAPVAMVIEEKRAGFPWKVILLIAGILVVILAAFLLSMKILGSRTPATPEPPAQLQEEEKVEEAENVEVQEKVEEVEKAPEPEMSRKDTDKDGLTDEQEKDYGTNIREEDTDSDGLFDAEEIKTWETDPLNSDTDGDGYLDGEEVDGGYNPNGSGVLREAPTESD